MDNKPEKIRVCFLEEWAPIDNDRVKKGMYEVSNAGRVRNTKGHILKQHLMNQGYPMVSLISSNQEQAKYVNQLTHRLVASAFVDKPDDNFNVVNHLDGIKTNPKYTNLEWTDHSHNVNHAIENGLMPNIVGEKQHMAKLTNEQVVTICEILQSGDYHDYADILNRIGMSVTDNNKDLIGNIKRRIAWKHISKDCEF